jgi:hypothetical protein
MNLQTRTDKSVDAILERLQLLEVRMTQLESDRGQMITEAKAAAGMAAAAIASNIVSDAITRITRLQMRQSDAAIRLPPIGPPETPA